MPITASPGTRFQYCSRCIVLAAYVLERITGQSWEDYTRTHIYTPLGMNTAAFGPLGLEQAADHARPYHHDTILGEVTVPWARLQYLDPLAPAGGIDANVDEMARYPLLQLGDGTIFGHRVVTAEMLAELHRPEIAVGADWTPAASVENLHYALGWFTADVRGLHLVRHNGANPGFRASIVLVPSFKTAVVILTNGESDLFTDAANYSLLEQLAWARMRSRRSDPGIKLIIFPKSASACEEPLAKRAEGAPDNLGRDPTGGSGWFAAGRFTGHDVVKPDIRFIVPAWSKQRQPL